MPKTFGIKEAIAAGEFATTKEQRRTVIAVVKMLGLPINLVAQVTKRTLKLKKVTANADKKIVALEKKVEVLEIDRNIDNDEIQGLQQTVAEWGL